MRKVLTEKMRRFLTECHTQATKKERYVLANNIRVYLFVGCNYLVYEQKHELKTYEEKELKQTFKKIELFSEEFSKGRMLLIDWEDFLRTIENAFDLLFENFETKFYK